MKTSVLKYSDFLFHTSKAILCVQLIWFLTGAAGFAQRPANDDFTNRLTFVGSSFTVTGSTLNATCEEFESRVWQLYAPSYPSQSVWFAWTPAQPSIVVIEKEDIPQAAGFYEQIGVFSGSRLTDGYGNVESKTIIAAPLSGLWTKIPFFAEAGSNYQIGVVGNLPSFALRFVAYPTNTPVFLEHPSSRAAPIGGSAFFSAYAVSWYSEAWLGITNWYVGRLQGISYGWFRNGQPVSAGAYRDHPGYVQHGWFYLALDNIRPEDAGAYTAVVGNGLGLTATSEVAVLLVSSSNILQTNVQSRLESPQKTGSNWLSFSVSGATGVCHRLESSSDLVHWQPEIVYSNFLSKYFFAVPGLNGANTFAAPTTGNNKFYRVFQLAPASDFCVNQLRQFQWAKNIWAAEHKKTLSDTPIETDLVGTDKYVSQSPRCPAGGIYNLGEIRAKPSCSVPGHTLE